MIIRSMGFYLIFYSQIQITRVAMKEKDQIHSLSQIDFYLLRFAT